MQVNEPLKRVPQIQTMEQSKLQRKGPRWLVLEMTVEQPSPQGDDTFHVDGVDVVHHVSQDVERDEGFFTVQLNGKKY